MIFRNNRPEQIMSAILVGVLHRCTVAEGLGYDCSVVQVLDTQAQGKHYGQQLISRVHLFFLNLSRAVL